MPTPAIHYWTPLHMSDILPNPVVAAGSATAVAAGSATAVLAQVGDAAAGNTVLAGILLAGSGIVTALFGGCVAFYKARAEDRRAMYEAESKRLQDAEERRQAEEKAKWEREQAEEKARFERHDLANKLHVALLQIDSQRHEIEELKSDRTIHQRTIDRLVKHSPSDPPVTPLGPDVAGPAGGANSPPRGPDYSS